jgi:hypothetical protein
VALDKINEYEMEQFQGGNKDVAIISKASGAGYSLHADKGAGNQKPRVHIVMELSWSADDQMQSFGRTHRSNQVQPPEYVIVNTDAGGEKRFSSTIARRLESLGALTKGQRDASGGGSVLAKYNFETNQGEEATAAFYQHLVYDDPEVAPGISGHDLLRQMGVLKQKEDAQGNPVGHPYIDKGDQTDVKRVLNRILNVEIGKQNYAYELFIGMFDAAVQRAIENGTLDTGVNLVRGDNIKLVSAKAIAKDPQSGAQTYRYAVEATLKNKPVQTAIVQDLHQKGTGHMYKRLEFKGVTEPDQLRWVIPSTVPNTLRNGSVEPAFNTISPEHRENGKSYVRIGREELQQYWERIEGDQNIKNRDDLSKRHHQLEEDFKNYKPGEYRYDYYKGLIANTAAELKTANALVKKNRDGQFNLWQQAVDAAPAGRTERVDMIGGSVMRVWPYLNVGRGRMDIRIAYPDSGGSITGVAMSHGDADRVERSLGNDVGARGADSVFEAALEGREKFNLAGNIKVTQGFVNRQRVVELHTLDENNKQFLRQNGVKTEKVGYQWKYYIPNDPKTGIPVLEKIMRQFPLVEEGGVPQITPRPTNRGSFRIGDIEKRVREMFGKDADAVIHNYSGWLAMHETLAAGGNLSQLREAAPEVWKEVVAYAAARAETNAIVRVAEPAIRKALEPSGLSYEELRQTRIEDRLRAIRQMYRDWAEELETADETELEPTYPKFAGILSQIDDKEGLPENPAQTAAAFMGDKNWDALREFLIRTWTQAAEHVAVAQSPDDYDRAMRLIEQHPEGNRLLDELIINQVARSHAKNEGIIATALGDLGYYPLVPLTSDEEETAKELAKRNASNSTRRTELKKPNNIANRFASGLSEGYDAGTEALVNRIGAIIATNSKAAGISAMRKSGLSRPLKRGEEMPEFYKWRGVKYEPAKMVSQEARTIIVDGKQVHIAAVYDVLPKWLAATIHPVFSSAAPTGTNPITRLAHQVNVVQMKGIADAEYHSMNLVGTLITLTPWNTGSTPGKIASMIPLAKTIYKVIQLSMVDTLDEQAVRDIQDMSRLGLVPPRYLSITLSRLLADQTGAKVARWWEAPSAFISGPKGIDIRTRLLMYRIAKEAMPNATAADIFSYMKQLGVYLRPLQSTVQKAAIDSGLGIFYTAGNTMWQNGISAFAGTGPIPPGTSRAYHIFSILARGALALIATWLLLNRLFTDNRKGDKLFKLSLPPTGHGIGHDIRASKLGVERYGPISNGVWGYLDMSICDPFVVRGSRALGIDAAINTKLRGGTSGQAFEAAAVQAADAIAHPILGPATQVPWTLLTGKATYMTTDRGRDGKMEPHFISAVPSKTPPTLKGEATRVAAALAASNAVIAHSGEAAGIFGEHHPNEGNRWVTMLMNMIPYTPFANGENPYATREILKKQAASEKKF